MLRLSIKDEQHIKVHVTKATAVLRSKSQMPWQPQSARAEAEATQQAVCTAPFNLFDQINASALIRSARALTWSGRRG